MMKWWIKANSSNPITFLHELLSFPTVILMAFGMGIGMLVWPVVHGFKIGLKEAEKFWGP